MRKRKYRQNRIFTLNNPLAPRICPELAKEIGLNESIVLLQLEFWMALEGVEREGYIWTRKTVREIQEVFDFWGIGTVERALSSLLRKGYVISAEFDSGSGRSARWLRFDFTRLLELQSIKVDCSIPEHPMFHPDDKEPQNGTININSTRARARVRSVDLKDKDIPAGAGYKVPKIPPEPKTLYPPEDFEILPFMRDHLAERFITFSEAELEALTDAWRRARNADATRKRDLFGWQWDWLRYICATWENRSRSGRNGHGEVQNDKPMKTIKEKLKLGLL